MNIRLSKNAVLAGLLLTVPCFAFLLFCNGFLPVAALAFVATRFLREAARDTATLIFVLPLFLEIAVYTFLLNKLAHRVTRSIHRDPARASLLSLVFLAGCAVWLVIPINTFDCMDGHGARRCSALRMYFGWLQSSDFGPGRDANRCGDFGW